MATKKTTAKATAKTTKTAAPKGAPEKAAKAKAKAKAKKVQAVPKGYGTATAYLIVSPCAQALELYGKAFGAKTLSVLPGPGDSIMHAEIKIGDTIVMMSDEQPPMPGGPTNRKTPKNLGGTTSGVMLYVKDCDAWFARAVSAGCTVSAPPMDMFWGDRFCQVEDPFGHNWSIATHVKDLTPKQMEKAMAEAMSQQGAPES